MALHRVGKCECWESSANNFYDFGIAFLVDLQLCFMISVPVRKLWSPHSDSTSVCTGEQPLTKYSADTWTSCHVSLETISQADWDMDTSAVILEMYLANLILSICF